MSILIILATVFSWTVYVYAVRKSSDIPRPFLANKQCRLIISELNIFPGGGTQYIELMRVCSPEPTNVFNVNMEKKYKLIFMDHSGFLVGVCDLKNEAYRRTAKFLFYVIGGSAVKNVDMPLNECDFAEDVDTFSSNNLPDPIKAPIAVALVHHPKGSLSWLSLRKHSLHKYKVPITNDLEEKIVPLVVDMYIYSTLSPFTSCDYFGTYYDGYKKDNQIILRDWANHGLDRSQSRCNPEEDVPNADIWNPMQPQYFKYARGTPGDVNDCKTAFMFRIEDTQPKKVTPTVSFRTTPEYACYITTEDPFIEAAFSITSPVRYHESLKMLIDEIEITQPVQVDSGLPLSEVTLASSSKPKPMDQKVFESELRKTRPHFWENCEKFPHKDFISELRNDKNQFVKPEYILRKDVCNWLEYLTPHSFRCKLCNSLWNQGIIFDRPGSSYLSAVKTPRPFRTGKSETIKYKNKKIIEQHEKSKLHILAIDYFKLVDAETEGEDLQEQFYREDGPMKVYIGPTEKTFVAVFQSTRMDIPFYKYPIMAQTLVYYDVKLGHLYHTASGAKAITMSISNTMHEDFANDLLSRQPELSILIDTGTDISTIASLAILFQTYDPSGKVVVNLYKLLPAGKHETGENLFSMFKTELEKDGLFEYVKNKCVGFASDGGSNVKKFRRLLKEWVARELMAVHCYAHKLDLALKHAWEQMPYLYDVDETSNGLYRMFNSRSHTKKALLYETAEQLGYARFELKRIVPTRWINTKRRALSTVLTNWKVLVTAVESVIEDRSTRRPQRVEAKSLDSSLKDPSLLSTMAFITDACEELAAVSIQLQGRSASLIGKKALRERLITRLTSLKTENGPRLQELLGKSTIPGDDSRSVNTLVEFETEDVETDGVLLHPYDLDENSLANQRSSYIDNVIEEIRSYFPTDVTDHLDIFDQRQWPENNLRNFGNAEILKLNEELRWQHSPVTILGQWIALKDTVVSRSDYQLLKDKTPEEFWIKLLTPGSGILWPEVMKVILTNLLVVPASTAEVERIYSLYTNIKTVQRYNLDVSTVEAIIRIKFNGPKDPADFNAARYARKFILSGHSRSDDETRRGKKRVREEDESDSEDIGPGGTREEPVGNSNSDVDEIEFPRDDDTATFRNTIFNGDEIEVAVYEDQGEDYE